MLRSNNSTTLLLFLIVLILLFGVGIALYYVFDLDWFEKKEVQIYNECNEMNEQPKVEIKIEKQIKYDINKRTYNIVINSDELRLIVYKDGTVGITMLENEKHKEIDVYSELVNKEIKLEHTNVIRAYEVEVAKENISNRCLILLDSDGNLYKLQEQELISNGKYVFEKIQGLAKIIDVRQITNDGLTENAEGVNVIAIDEESNELLLTDYLIK